MRARWAHPVCETAPPPRARVPCGLMCGWVVSSHVRAPAHTDVRGDSQVVDIAGLVKGASSGEGLGNAFLSHIKAVDGIFHVLRAFEVHPFNSVQELIKSELAEFDAQRAFASCAGCTKRRRDERIKPVGYDWSPLAYLMGVVGTAGRGNHPRGGSGGPRGGPYDHQR
jgi:hypothetical protein